MMRIALFALLAVSCGKARDPAPRVDPQTTLDGLDKRVPVPLLPMMANHQKQNMRDHLAAVQEIVAAVAVSDFVAAEKAAKRIGTSPQMTQMCSHMGAGAPGFTDQALGFHATADEIVTAARAKDGLATLAALGKTLGTCTSCHERFKQDVVDEAGYAKASGGAVPAMHH